MPAWSAQSELDPDYSDAWAVLANIYAQEYRFGYNPRPELYDLASVSLALLTVQSRSSPRETDCPS